MEKFIKIVMSVLGSIGVIVVIAIVLALPLVWTWNYVMPYLFGLKTIGWIHAWCLMFVSGCLLKKL